MSDLAHVDLLGKLTAYRTRQILVGAKAAAGQ